MNHRTVSDPAAILTVLTSHAATPPARSGDGATLRLRAAMARFAAPSEHGPRRQQIDHVIERLDVEFVRQLARRMTDDELAQRTGVVDGVALARSVPVRALLAALGLVESDGETTAIAAVADVDAIAAVIGRGDEASADADAAATRLLTLAATSGDDPVAVVSILYQCLDAVAALIATTLHARARAATGTRSVLRVPAVPRTMRVATEPFSVGAERVSSGEVMALEIGPAGLEFGAGPHACAGRQLAEAITTAIADAIERTHHVDVAAVTVDPDGRPTTLPLVRRAARAPVTIACV